MADQQSTSEEALLDQLASRHLKAIKRQEQASGTRGEAAPGSQAASANSQEGGQDPQPVNPSQAVEELKKLLEARQQKEQNRPGGKVLNPAPRKVPRPAGTPRVGKDPHRQRQASLEIAKLLAQIKQDRQVEHTRRQAIRNTVQSLQTEPTEPVSGELFDATDLMEQGREAIAHSRQEGDTAELVDNLAEQILAQQQAADHVIEDQPEDLDEPTQATPRAVRQVSADPVAQPMPTRASYDRPGRLQSFLIQLCIVLLSMAAMGMVAWLLFWA